MITKGTCSTSSVEFNLGLLLHFHLHQHSHRDLSKASSCILYRRPCSFARATLCSTRSCDVLSRLCPHELSRNSSACTAYGSQHKLGPCSSCCGPCQYPEQSDCAFFNSFCTCMCSGAVGMVQGCANLVGPLTKLMRMNESFVWSADYPDAETLTCRQINTDRPTNRQIDKCVYIHADKCMYIHADECMYSHADECMYIYADECTYIHADK